MTDPYVYVMLHKYKHLERVKEAEHDRLVQSLSRPTLRMQRLMDLSRRMVKWWTLRHLLKTETPVIEGKVVMP